MLVVDVSYHNGVINWKKAKEAGVVGAIIRCGYGRDFTKYDDSRYRANMDGALAVGIKVGVYLYSYAKTIESAKSEAAHVLRLVAPYKSRISLPIYYDLEEEGTQTGAKERAIVFGEILEAQGYTVGVYANEYWWRTYLKGLDRFNKWVAKWGSVEPKGFSNMELWQYDAYGRVNGIGSGVDLDKPYGKIAEILSGKDPVKEDKVMIEVEELRKTDPTMKGPEVFAVQSILRAKGYKYGGSLIKCDSSYGKITENCVIAFQKNNSLVADGIVGAKTWDKLLKG